MIGLNCDVTARRENFSSDVDAARGVRSTECGLEAARKCDVSAPRLDRANQIELASHDRFVSAGSRLRPNVERIRDQRHAAAGVRWISSACVDPTGQLENR